MEPAFAPVSAAALHCAELLGHAQARGGRPEERAALLAAWRRDCARLLAEDLAPLLAADRLTVTIAEPERLAGHAALARIDPAAANSLLRCGSQEMGETALLSVDFATATALTDRSFGGDGAIGEALVETLPRSAALLVEDAARRVALAMARAGSGGAAGDAPVGEVIMRSESAARLKPFAPDAEVLVFTIVIATREGREWRASLALAAERIERLLPGAQSPRPRTPRRDPAAPFAEMPLSLHAVLAEFDLSLTRLDRLAPGDTIAFAMPRQVPLMVGDTLVARGTVGTAEDRMALRLETLPASTEGLAR